MVLPHLTFSSFPAPPHHPTLSKRVVVGQLGAPLAVPLPHPRCGRCGKGDLLRLSVSRGQGPMSPSELARSSESEPTGARRKNKSGVTATGWRIASGVVL
jgi:hypothetical protein